MDGTDVEGISLHLIVGITPASALGEGTEENEEKNQISLLLVDI